MFTVLYGLPFYIYLFVSFVLFRYYVIKYSIFLENVFGVSRTKTVVVCEKKKKYKETLNNKLLLKFFCLVCHTKNVLNSN